MVVVVVCANQWTVRRQGEENSTNSRSNRLGEELRQTQQKIHGVCIEIDNRGGPVKRALVARRSSFVRSFAGGDLEAVGVWDQRPASVFLPLVGSL